MPPRYQTHFLKTRKSVKRNSLYKYVNNLYICKYVNGIKYIIIYSVFKFVKQLLDTGPESYFVKNPE